MPSVLLAGNHIGFLACKIGMFLQPAKISGGTPLEDWAKLNADLEK